MRRNFRLPAGRSAAPNADIAGISPVRNRSPRPNRRLRRLPSRSPSRSRRRGRGNTSARRGRAQPPAGRSRSARRLPAPAPLRRRPRRRKRFREQRLQTAAVVAGWIGLVAVVLLIGYSAVRYRRDIAAIWPQSAGVYSGLGMPVNCQRHRLPQCHLSPRKRRRPGRCWW